MMRTRRSARAILALIALGAGPVVAAPPPPRTQLSVDGPVDLDEMLQVARIRAAQMASTFYKYTFRQTVTEEDLNEDGSVKRKETRVYLVVPSPDGTERHLESTDGEPPTEAEQRKQDKRNEALKRRWAKIREKNKKAAERRGRTQSDPPANTKAPTTQPASPATRPAPALTTPATAATPTAPPAAQPAPVPDGRVELRSTPTTNAPATTSPPATVPAASPSAPALPPLPPCVEDDLESSLRPPFPGSITRTQRPPKLAPEEARRNRDKTSDYSLWELLSLTDYEYVGACQIDGRPMHVLTFSPPETFDAANPVERVMTGMAGTLLIDGRDLQVARAEGLTVAPMTWGAGMVKLKEAHVLLEYAKVQGEIWLPSRDVFEFDTRVVLDHDKQRVTHVFDDFKKATVEIETEYEWHGDEGQ